MERVRGPLCLTDILDPSGCPSILITRFKALGDIVLSFPIVKALRSAYPHSRINYLCRSSYAQVLSGLEELDKVLILPDDILGQVKLALLLRREKLDCSIDLLCSPRSALFCALAGARIRIGFDTKRHNWCYNVLLPRAILKEKSRFRCYTMDSNEELLRMLCLPADPRRGCPAPGGNSADSSRYAIGLPAARSELGWASDFRLAIAGRDKLCIGLVPAALYQAKSWKEEYFIEVARRIHEDIKAVPLILWGPGEKDIAERISAKAPGSVMAPETGIARLGALVSILDLLVGIDSGPKHLAVIQGVPTVTIFGPTDPRIWDPMTEEHRALHKEIQCFPCKKKRCDNNRCMQEITPDMVMSEIESILKIRRKSSREGNGK